MFNDAVLLLLFALSTFLLQLLGLPLLLIWLKKIPSQSQWWAWGRVIGWLVPGLLIWFSAHLGLPINSTLGFWSILSFSLIAIYGFSPLQVRSLMKVFLRTHWQKILIQEALFLTGFLFLGLTRTFHPAILDLEKFMNAGLMQGYLRSPTLPAEDMWLAGKSINYYSFGHFLGSLLLRFWNVPVAVGFNVLLSWMMGLILIESYALSQSILGKLVIFKKHLTWPLLISGLTGALLIVFGGNTHPLWYLLTQHNFTGYWYPEAVRFIDFTIHEIPAYSFIVSDLHAHFWSVPLVLLMIFTIWQWSQTIFTLKTSELVKPTNNQLLVVNNLILGSLLGVLGMTNTWDMMIYSWLLLVLGSLIILFNKKTWLVIVVAGLQVILAALIIIAPWYLNFSSIITGIFAVPSRSPFWQLIALWSGQVSLSLVALGLSWRLFKKQPKLISTSLFILSLGLVGLGCIILPEVIYFKDIYPTYQRANTMFKFTFQGFILMNLLIAWLMGFLLIKLTWLKNYCRWLLLTITGLFIISTLTYPFLGYPNYYHHFHQSQSLDGLYWLSSTNPSEYQAIMWLKNETQGRPVVLEAVGDSYSGFARVSVFSGLPTVIGWRAHEWLWRGGPEISAQRSSDVQWVYEQPLSLKAAKILNQYAVKYIFIGSKEREAYKFDLEDVLSLGKVVFQQNNIYVLERMK